MPRAPGPPPRAARSVSGEDGVNGMVEEATLGMAVERGARTDDLARTLTAIQLGRDLLREIELGAESPSVSARLVTILGEARRRAERLGALPIA